MADPILVPVKKPWFSKTLWVNAVIAVLALIGVGGAQEWLANNQMIVLGGVAVINIVLRLLTKGAIQIED